MPGREPCWPRNYCYQDGEMCEIKDNSIFSAGKFFLPISAPTLIGEKKLSCPIACKGPPLYL